MDKNKLLENIKKDLQSVYGNRLKRVILYGSEAMGNAAPDSDIDLLVLLEGTVSLGKETETIVKALYPLQLEILRPIHAIPVNVKTYDAGEFALFRNAKKEGIPA
ncbi:MAG: nucleotidyltransferase domain-containing protein [Nitrospinota bacterium]